MILAETYTLWIGCPETTTQRPGNQRDQHRCKHHHNIRQHWPIKSELAITDGIKMEEKRILIIFIAEVDNTAATQ